MPIDKEEDWQSFFQGSFLPAQSGSNAGRIEPVITPEILDKSIIRISARSIEVRARNWWRAGTLTQEIGLGMEFQRWNIPLGRKSIIKIEFAGKYRMRFDAVRWLSNLYLEIDTYEGSL